MHVGSRRTEIGHGRRIMDHSPSEQTTNPPLTTQHPQLSAPNFRARMRQDPRSLCGVKSWRLDRLAHHSPLTAIQIPRSKIQNPPTSEKLPYP